MIRHQGIPGHVLVKVILCLSLLVAFTPTFAEASVSDLNVTATFTINQRLFTKQQVSPLVDAQGRVLVPLRFVVEALGAEVKWNSELGLLQIGTGDSHIAMLKGSQRVYVNGAVEFIDNPLYYHQQRGVNYVPLRFIASYCGGAVSYQQDPITKSVVIRIDGKSFTSQDRDGMPTVDRGFTRVTITEQELTRLLTPEMPSLGAAISSIKSQMGSPLRTDINNFGDEVSVYAMKGHYRYIDYRQNRVTSWQIFGSQWQVGQLESGQSWETVTAVFPFREQQQITIDNAVYTLSQETKDIGSRLMFVRGNTIVECYFDPSSDSLVAVRCSRPEAVIASKSYPMSCKYYGVKPNISLPLLSTRLQIRRDTAITNQIQELTNCYRKMRGVPLLQISDFAERIALSHSRDMLQHGFVGHTSPYSGSLKQRYSAHASQFVALSENIAYGSFEAIEAIHSWIISPGHRENMLSAIFTHIGVGTAKDYYTQNYLRYK